MTSQRPRQTCVRRRGLHWQLVGRPTRSASQRAPIREHSSDTTRRLGGEAVSLALNHSQAAFFRAAPYQPLVAGGERLGRVREYGNLSFAVVDGAGHFVPAEKPELALEVFRRAVAGLDVATGQRAAGNATMPFAPDTPLPTAAAAGRPAGVTAAGERTRDDDG